MTMVLRRCDAVFNVFRRHLVHEARVVVISAAYGKETFRHIPEAQRSKLFPDAAPCRMEELVSVARAFHSELAVAKGFNWQLPCKSLGGWWLDPDGFAFLLVNALVRSWQLRQTVGLCVCACGCVPGARPEADEAQTVLMLMDGSRSRDSLAGKLFTSFAAGHRFTGMAAATTYHKSREGPATTVSGRTCHVCVAADGLHVSCLPVAMLLHACCIAAFLSIYLVSSRRIAEPMCISSGSHKLFLFFCQWANGFMGLN